MLADNNRWDIAFIILNYQLYRETISCVRSIADNIDTDNYLIIIVDNASPNHVGKRLQLFFDGDSNVEVLINERNMGFSKGNNIGINHIRKHRGGARFICCLNNDVIIEQKNMYKVLRNISVMDSSIAIIGPRIYDGFYKEYANPEGLRDLGYYKRQLQKYIDAYNNPRIIESEKPIRRFLLKNKLLYDLNSVRHRVKNRVRKIISYSKNRKAYMANLSLSETDDSLTDGRYDLVLHGCFLVFTETFFKMLCGFDPSTFMYGEETLLFVDVTDKNLHTYKSDHIHIIHLEATSTNTVFNSSYKKQRFIWKNEIVSTRVLIQKLEGRNRKTNATGHCV